MSIFDPISPAPLDPIFGVIHAFQKDPRLSKVNLSVGLYRTLDLKTPILNCVKKAENALLDTEKSKEYLPIDGDPAYIHQVGMLVFGAKFWAKNSKRIHGMQAVGGTHALRIGGDFLKQEIGDTIYLSTPTWPNHRGVFARCGFKVEEYPYYDLKNAELRFDLVYNYLSALPPKSIVLLHACCHNPTGADLKIDEWQKLSSLFLAKGLIPFFDMAYQGFDKGVEEDVQAVRLFAEAGHEMLIAISFSKNFSLYAERVGALLTFASSEKAAQTCGSKIRSLVRTNISNPPKHGALIVEHVLKTPELKKEWEGELASMRERLIEMRHAFTSALVSKSGRKEFAVLNERTGLFCFSGLGEEAVERLAKEYGIYMPKDGRMNIAGLNWDNLDYVVDAIVNVGKNR